MRELLSKRDQPADDAAFISIDGRGADVRVRTGGDYSVERIGFDKVRQAWGARPLGVRRTARGPCLRALLMRRAWPLCVVCVEVAHRTCTQLPCRRVVRAGRLCSSCLRL